jgi:hypothetical protein
MIHQITWLLAIVIFLSFFHYVSADRMRDQGGRARTCAGGVPVQGAAGVDGGGAPAIPAGRGRGEVLG